MVLSKKLKWVEEFEDVEEIIEYFKPDFDKVNKYLIEQYEVGKEDLKSFDDLINSEIYKRTIVEAILESLNKEYWFYYDMRYGLYMIYEVE